jgi:hypothetical protein
MQYKKLDGTWADFVVPAELTDAELLAMIEDLTQKITDLELLVQGLASYTEVSE